MCDGGGGGPRGEGGDGKATVSLGAAIIDFLTN